MIIPNGTIEFISMETGGLDEMGYPVEESKTYGKPVLCQYEAVTRDFLGKTNGETFTRATYSILIETIPHCRMTRLIRLKCRHCNVIGEFPVLNIEPLDAVCQIRILV